MKKYLVRQYQTTDFEVWNTFVSVAKNATFLFHRNFMEYHKDRFEDFSLMVYYENKLVAILPANRIDDKVFSHNGLTYGGLVLDEKAKLSTTILIFKSILEFLNESGISKLNIKEIPSFYCSFFSSEMDYCLFILQANLTRRDALSVIDLSKPFVFSKDRKQSIKRGERNNLVVKEEFDFDLFWNEILIPNMNKKHQTNPVHSLEEMELLHNYFPKNIRQFNVYVGEKIVAGTTIFENDFVAHSQYISGNSLKNELGSLDFLHSYLLEKVFCNKKYFDFGISNENNGRTINNGLLYWKESFGAKTVTQSFYEVETKNHTLLASVLL